MSEDLLANIEITPREVKDLLARDPKVLFVDVREQWEYDTARIAGSVLIPLGEIPANLQRLENAEQRCVLLPSRHAQPGRRRVAPRARCRGQRNP